LFPLYEVLWAGHGLQKTVSFAGQLVLRVLVVLHEVDDALERRRRLLRFLLEDGKAEAASLVHAATSSSRERLTAE